MDLRPLTDTGVAWSQAELDLDAAARDLWPRHTLGLRDGALPPRPALITWPRNRDEVASVLRAAAELDLAQVHGGLVPDCMGRARG